MNIDNRYELKFVLDDASLTTALEWMYKHTPVRERYSKRKVNSLYFDDVEFTSVRDNLAGISDRKKMRLRWYGDEDYSCPRLETKIRNGRLGYKISHQVSSLQNNLLGLDLKDIQLECEKEIKKRNSTSNEYFIPTLQTRYDREYYEDLNGIRITIDQNIQFFESLPYLKLNETIPISYPNKIMELKFDPNIKQRVAELMRPLHITPKRHSKYLIGLAKLGYTVYI